MLPIATQLVFFINFHKYEYIQNGLYVLTLLESYTRLPLAVYCTVWNENSKLRRLTRKMNYAIRYSDAFYRRVAAGWICPDV
jgi:hypothetical protein